MNIVETHSHLGPCRVFDIEVSEKEILKAIDEYNLTAIILQPFPGAPDPKAIHDKIAALSKEYPGKIFGIVSLNPHISEDEYISEADRLIKDYGFVGLKIHTVGHAINPLSNDAKKVFEAAKRLGVPVMIHTGPGVPFALPSMVIPRAMEYPDVPIILAHAGYGLVITAEVFAMASVAKNLYVETSWTSIFDKKNLLYTWGPERIIFGADLLYNIPVELYQYKLLNIPEEDLEKILFKNAMKVFKLKL